MSTFRRKTKKDGSITYTWRGKVPYRKATGETGWKSVERGTGASTLAEARGRAKQIEREYHERCNLPLADAAEPDPVTFAEASIAYMKAGGERRYLAPILERIGNVALTEVSQEIVQGLAEKLKPGCTAGTINRHIFTPILSVLNFAAGLKMCPPPVLVRPKGHDKSPTLEIPDENWFRAVLPRLAPTKRAGVLCTTLHGMRISEAIERRPHELDMKRGELSVPDSKTGVPFVVSLAEPVLEAIRAIPDWQKQKWLFGTCHRSNFARDVNKACDAAGVRRFGSHAIGRHSFATRVLRAGKSLAFLKDAGRWATITMPAMRYGHLEQSEVQAAVKDLASQWREEQQPGDVVSLSAKRARAKS